MRRIVKGQPPPEVVATAKASTTNLHSIDGARTAFNQLGKPALRAALVAEQRSLCAYCMQRISAHATDADGHPQMRIAHRTPIAVDASAALTWTNLLGSCDGGQARTCDVAQGSRSLTIDPCSAESVARLRYERRSPTSGLFLTSDDDDVRCDVDATLRLNDGYLPANREAAWTALQVRARRNHPSGPYGKPAWRLELARRASAPMLDEYFGMLESKVR